MNGFIGSGSTGSSVADFERNESANKRKGIWHGVCFDKEQFSQGSIKLP